MAIKHAAWTHGSDIQLESLSWRALRQGYWTTFYRRDVPGDPQVLWGTNISLGIEFEGDGADAWVALVSAGIDFYA
ncbi:hypothetical protein W97_06259 [Coniosporium apollinis CBS 100218]|uniref:Uncharacterized protein n=1 Tax=Coniosporium apollinis (strain CBS 100218) TaxID=1168221 RepID=R7YY71_CONA1|nr:uncharacterized protein W97_06259 [Coniosporium apollinis CBS 100218]EON66857.1 hypothetical protein W97_06259 [Coniosporium apollinis CBS 100218]